MDTIINHPDLRSVNTFNSNLKKGDINPLLRKSYKQLVNINSRFRNNYTITPAANFGFTLPSPIKKVVSMKVVDVQVPKMIYTVSDLLGSNKFNVTQAATTKTISIASGSYTGTEIATAITTALNPSYPNIIVAFNKITGLITFSDSTTIFNLDFSYTDPSCNIFGQTGSNLYKDQLTLGWLLGFRQNYKYSTPLNTISRCDISNTIQTATITPHQLRGFSNMYSRRPTVSQVKQNGYRYLQHKNQCLPQQVYEQPLDISYNYSGLSTYVGEGIYDSHGSRYFLLSVNDFQNNHNITVVSPLQQETLGDGNILAKISSECCNKCCYENTERIYFGPTDINKIHLTLYDEFGRIVDLNNGDYSITLEVEVLYDL